MTRPLSALQTGHRHDDAEPDDHHCLSLGAERFPPIADEAPRERRVRLLRQEHRARTHIRALLYAGRSFQTTTIVDLSPSGAGLDGVSSVLPGDLVALQLLDGRAIAGQVRWWLGGRCGIAFLEALKDFKAIVEGPYNRLRATNGSVPAVPVHHPNDRNLERKASESARAGGGLVDDAERRDPYVAATEALSERLKERYLRNYSGQ